MNNKTLQFVLSILAFLGFALAISEHAKRRRIQLVLKKKNENYLRLLSQYVEDSKGQLGASKKINSQLEALQKEYAGVHKEVASKLQTVMELIADKKEEIAIEKLTTIIENILKDKYISEGKAKDKKSYPALFKLLEQARDLKWITTHHFNFSLFLKEKRNQEAHELTSDINENEKVIAFLSGIEIIYQLKGIKRVA